VISWLSEGPTSGVKYRWCQISEVLAFLLQKAAAAVTGNYILCRELISGWRSFELRGEKGEMKEQE